MRKDRTFRIRAMLDERLQAAAAQTGRSVSEEIEHRLERSFWQDDAVVEALREMLEDEIPQLKAPT